MMDSAVTGALTGQTMQSAGEALGEGVAAPHPFAKAEISESHDRKSGLSENQLIRALEEDPATPGNSTED
jgi:hypothetical protein